MIKNLKHILPVIAVLALPSIAFAQAPTLGTAASFVLFTTTGAVTNTGPSHFTGNVGTNNGAISGFGNVNGNMHTADGVTAAATAGLLSAYNQLDGTAATFFPAPLLGNGQTLNAGVYEISGNSTLNLILNLDGQNDPNAVFIIRIDGTLSSAAAAQVVLLNDAKACNVFWQVEGMVSLAANTKMRGNIIANNSAIDMGVGVRLEGRALSIAGAITTNTVRAYTPTGCGSPVLSGPAAPALGSVNCYALFTANGPLTNSGISNVTGDVGTNVGLTTGFNPLFVNGMIHPIPDGSTAAAASDLLNAYNNLNLITHDIELLYPAQFGNSLVLTPHAYLLNGATTLTDSLYLNAEGNPNAVFVIMVNGALSTSTFATVQLMNGAQASNVFWKVEGAIDISDFSKVVGTLIANNGAVSLNTGVDLDGRALSTNGAFLTASVESHIPASSCGVAPPAANLTVNQNQPATATNFQSFATMAAFLNTSGVTEATIIDVVPGSGPYSGQFTLGQVPGSSTTNTVTINGNNQVINFCSGSAGGNVNMILLDGTDNVTINGLSLTASCKYGTGIRLMNGTNNITLSNNTINVLVPGPNSTSTANRGIYATNAGSLSITGNTIIGGRRGIQIENSTAPAYIIANTLTEAYEYGVSLVSVNGAVVADNQIAMRNNYAASVAINGNMLIGFTFDGNFLTNAGRAAIQLNNSGNGTSTVQASIVNNRIGFFQPSLKGYGVYLYGVDGVNIYHNSILTDAVATGNALRVGASSGLNVRNNILAFTGTGSGTPLYGAPSSFTMLSQNDYFHGAGGSIAFLNKAVTDLNALEDMGYDITGSFIDNPAFTTDLRTGNTNLYDVPSAALLVALDFEGDERNTGSIDLGADESNIVARFAASAPEIDAEVYPNPFQTGLTIKLKDAQTGNVQVTVSDLIGRQVFAQQYIVEAKTSVLAVAVQETLPQGIYLLKVTQGNFTSTFRIVKQ